MKTIRIIIMGPEGPTTGCLVFSYEYSQALRDYEENSKQFLPRLLSGIACCQMFMLIEREQQPPLEDAFSKITQSQYQSSCSRSLLILCRIPYGLGDKSADRKDAYE